MRALGFGAVGGKAGAAFVERGTVRGVAIDLALGGSVAFARRVGLTLGIARGFSRGAFGRCCCRLRRLVLLTHPELLSRTQIVLPALGLSLAVNLVLSLVFSLVYSQRLAGPIHRFKTDIEKLEKGEPLKAAFHLRDADEFKDLAHSFDLLLKRLAEKGYLKEL